MRLLFIFPPGRNAAAEDDDVKSQLEKLWREVNSLKEMQALQTGTAKNNRGEKSNVHTSVYFLPK